MVRDPDPANVGRQFSSAAVELALASYPGFPSPHRRARAGLRRVHPYVDAGEVPHVAVHADGSRVDIAAAADTRELAPVDHRRCPNRCRSSRRRAPLGMIAGARQQGGGANVGVWVRTDEQWRWLAHALTVDKLRELLPETADLPVTRHLLPNLRAVNFVIDGILGRRRLSGPLRPAGQGLGEWLRSRHIDIPELS